jgi:hypothetical protein
MQKKVIGYITAGICSEQTLVVGLLHILFLNHITIRLLDWDEVGEFGVEKYDPDICLILCSPNTKVNNRPEIWQVIREDLPDVPVIWLEPEEKELAPEADEITRVLEIDLGKEEKRQLREFITGVANFLQIQPVINL